MEGDPSLPASHRAKLCAPWLMNACPIHGPTFPHKTEESRSNREEEHEGVSQARYPYQLSFLDSEQQARPSCGERCSHGRRLGVWRCVLAPAEDA